MMTDADALAVIEAELGCDLVAVDHPTGEVHHNVHYRSTLPDGTSVFVKLIDDDRAYYIAEVRAACHLASTDIRTPRLITSGVIDHRRRWLAYQWHDLAPFLPSRRHVELAGELLGSLHAATTGISEHAAIGHPLLDFAKLWDRELDDPEARAAFLSGYRKHQPDITTKPDAINAVRLWAAAGIIPYARSREDHDFEHHARQILSRLEERE